MLQRNGFAAAYGPGSSCASNFPSAFVSGPTTRPYGSGTPQHLSPAGRGWGEGPAYVGLRSYCDRSGSFTSCAKDTGVRLPPPSPNPSLEGRGVRRRPADPEPLSPAGKGRGEGPAYVSPRPYCEQNGSLTSCVKDTGVRQPRPSPNPSLKGRGVRRDESIRNPSPLRGEGGVRGRCARRCPTRRRSPSPRPRAGRRYVCVERTASSRGAGDVRRWGGMSKRGDSAVRWREIVRRRADSGLSVAAYCRRGSSPRRATCLRRA